MSRSAFIILDPFSSGNNYAPAACAKGLNPVVVRTWTPPRDAPIHRFLPVSLDADVLDLDVDHLTVLFGSDDDRKRQGLRLWEQLNNALRAMGLTPRGVVAGSELSVILADDLAERWALPGNDPSRSLACRHKGEMKELAARNQIACADYSPVMTEVDVECFVKKHYPPTIRRPMFLKPPCGGGSTRVRKCRSEEEVRRNLPGVLGQPDFFGFRAGFALLETHLSGVEYAVNLFADGHDLFVTDIWQYLKKDTNAELGFGNNVYYDVFAVPYADTSFSRLGEAAKRIARTFGRSLGPMHLELMANSEQISLVEIGARLAGAMMPAVLRDASGWDVVDASVSAACGERPVPPPERGISVAVAIVNCPIAVEGRVVEVVGIDEIRQLPTYHHHSKPPDPGEQVWPTEDTSTCPLLVYLMHEEEGSIRRDADRVHQLFKVVVE